MADPTPVPAPEPTPDVAPPSPTKTRPVVLATVVHVTRFVIPAGAVDGIKDDTHITHVGVPLSKKQADATEALAAQYGVRLIDITPTEKD